MGIEQMTPESLARWANSLGVCRFEREGDAAVARRGRKLMRLSLGRFAEGIHGGAAYVSFWGQLEDGGGCGCPCRTVEEAAREVDRFASAHGMRDEFMQLALF